MSDFIYEKQSLFDYLKTVKKPIMIYGMGNGADNILNLCTVNNITVSEIFASDEFVRGHSFRDFKVKTLSEIQKTYSDFIILLAFAAFEESLINRLYDLSKKYELYAPDTPLFGGGYFDVNYLEENIDEFNYVYNRLEDDFSKSVFTNIINFKITGKIEYLSPISTTRLEDYQSLLSFNSETVYVDLGAYNGDTIEEVLSINSEIKKIIAFEPDVKNYKKLIQNTQNLNNIECYNIGSYSKEDTLYFSGKGGRNSALKKDGDYKISVNSVDNILNGGKASYIKLDVEGAELKSLEGAKNTIKTFKPSLGIAAYHRNDDFFTLIKYIDSLTLDYKIYLRHNHYIPAWETIIYAVSEN